MEQNNEIDRIQQEIHKLRTVGINADQEDKSPMEEYIDTVAERRMISELEEQIQKIKDRNPELVAKQLIEDVCTKWAEEELAKVKISEQDQARAFSDILVHHKETWYITPDKIEYIGPYTTKEAQSIMNYRMNGNGANTIEELTVDEIKERYQMDEEEVQKLREIAGEKYKYSSVGVNASRIGSPVANIDSNVGVYETLEEIRAAMSYLNIQCDLMMPIKNDTMHYMECEFTRKVALLITEKLQRTINAQKYIYDGTE